MPNLSTSSFREQVQRAVGLLTADPVDAVERAVREIALCCQSTLREQEVLDGLASAECGLDRVLRRHIGTHSHVGQQFDAFDETRRPLEWSGDGQPSGSEPADAVGLGQPRVCQTQNVSPGHRRKVCHGSAVVDDLLVDLVGEEHQVMLAGNVDEALQHLRRVDGARRIVGIDDDNPSGARRDPGFQIVEVRCPALAFIGEVVNRRAAGK